jgi:NAD(P)-dependent dehydrogenase (short-subunit alcohol dehydrogenase family)
MPIALVTGGNRGLGLGACRELARKGYQVLLGSRTLAKGEKAAKALRAEGLDVAAIKLDVSSDADVKRAAARIKKAHKRLDVLVNNAGIMIDRGGRGTRGDGGTSAFKVPPKTLLQTFQANTVGAYRACQAFIPLMGGRGRVVNVSSGMGQLSDMNGSYPGYRLSKTALNAVTRVFADELKATGVLVNSVCPGWCRTDMGGSEATRSIEEGVDTIVWAATLPDDGPRGGFFRDRKPIPW